MLERPAVPKKLETPETFSERFPLLGETLIEIREEQGDTIDITIVTKGSQFSLKEIVPGVTFHLSDRIQVNTRTSQVFVTYEMFKNPRSILLILHEIGHLQAKLKREADGQSETQQQVREARGKEFNEASERDVSLILKDERDAWAQALRTARHIPSRIPEIDIFALFNNKEEVSGWIRLMGLSSYECDVAEKAGLKPAETQTSARTVNPWLNEQIAEMYEDEKEAAHIARTRLSSN